MIFTFILGAIAGFIVPWVEPFVRQGIEQIALKEIPISDTEFDVLTLVLLLLLVSVLTFGNSSIALLLGALLGVFGKNFVSGGRSR